MTSYAFDNAYRLTQITDPLGHIKQFGYDDMSFMTSYTDPLGKVTNYESDDFGRLEEIVYPAATSGGTRLKEKFAYDKTGRITKFTDTANRDTVYAYDDVNRINIVTNAEGEVITTKYNLRFQTIEVKDALNQIYTFGYDAMGRVLSQTRAGASMSLGYDEVGNQTKRTDYAGRVTNYEYDNLNRLKKIVYGNPVGANQPPNQQSTYGYDDLSRLTSATNENGTVSFGYDNRNRTTSTTDVFGQALAYEYERTSTVNQKRLKLNGSLYATYNFDDVERLVNIVNASDSTTISFGYDNEDKLTSRVYPNGVTTTYEYFDDDAIKRLKDFTSSTTLFDRQYTYSVAHQIESITGLSGSRSFGYDFVNRLKTVTGASTETYNYDDVGNRTSSHLSNTYSYQPFNKLTATQNATYGFDANGNTTTKSEGSNFWRYGWDHENRLVSASTRKQSVRYKYDALGRRVQRFTPGGKESTKFTYDGDDVLMDDDKGTITKYLNGEGIDNKLRQTTASNVNYFLTDHLGSTNGLTDSAGTITSQTGYDSFGNQSGTISSRYGYTGRERDDFTGLMYYRARFYDPNLGRFISEDPIGFAGGDVNLFAYVWNNPQGYTDPSGLYPYKLPANPGKNGSNLPQGWRPVPEHKHGERWVSPDGKQGVDFHPGKEGKDGYRGKDHWHKLKPDRTGKLKPDKSIGRDGGHHFPGDEVDVDAPDLSQPTAEECRLNEDYYRNIEYFWWKVLAGTGAAVAGYYAPVLLPPLLPAIPPLMQQGPRFAYR